MFIMEQTKEIMYKKWNRALMADLFCNIISMFYFCLHCRCTQIIIIFIFYFSTDLWVIIFQISNIGINAINDQP